MDASNMNKATRTAVISSLLVLGSTVLATAPAQAANAWQEQQLHAPAPGQLERERTGQVTIYTGFTDVQVAQAMTEQFDRVESMMFVNTVVTRPDGQPKQDPDSGKPVMEDDGC